MSCSDPWFPGMGALEISGVVDRMQWAQAWEAPPCSAGAHPSEQEHPSLMEPCRRASPRLGLLIYRAGMRAGAARGQCPPSVCGHCWPCGGDEQACGAGLVCTLARWLPGRQ